MSMSVPTEHTAAIRRVITHMEHTNANAVMDISLKVMASHVLVRGYHLYGSIKLIQVVLL